jgi:serine protease
LGENTEVGNSGSNAPLLPNFGPDSTLFTGRYGGTSAATPMVAGVAALVRSVNPCLSNLQVKNVLLQTADKIGGFNYNWSNQKPGHSKEVGYGKVNALKAVQAAAEMNSASIDLMVKDVPQDFGYEPDTIANRLYTSEAIWVRNNPDGFVKQWHQTPQYVSNTPVYVYVRVNNKSCVDATAGDSLKLYWAKASTALSWPIHWNGSLTSPALMGDEIGSMALDTILAGTEKILQFSWQPPNPNNYIGINPEHWHFCLLARVVSSIDTMTVPETTTLWRNVRNNNNIAWKNISIIKKTPLTNLVSEEFGVGAVVAIGNETQNQEEKTIELKFTEEENAFGASIFHDAEVRIKLDEVSYTKWLDGGEQQENFKHLGDGLFLAVAENPTLKNLNFSEGERATMHVGFNLLTEEVGNKSNYKLYVEQFDNEGFIGGEQFIIESEERPLFIADAGLDENVEEGTSVQLRAYLIGESATYNWYNENGDLFHTGAVKNFIATENETFTLEVIAHADGYKDYDKKEITIKNYYITDLFPNPLSNQNVLNVVYEASQASTAHFTLTNINTNQSTTHVLNPNQQGTAISLQNFTAGSYVLYLICDGAIRDAKTFNIY